MALAALSCGLRPRPAVRGAGIGVRYGGVQCAEHPVRFDVTGCGLQRLLGGRDRFADAILPQVQAGELSLHVGRHRVERDRALVRRDGAIDIVVSLETPRQ